jgi:hypothetical protein
MTDEPAPVPTLSLGRARAILQQRGARDPVTLIGVRGWAPAMGAPGVNDLGIYDDEIFLVTPEACAGFVANTDPSRAEPPNVQLKAGMWRYQLGTHTPEGGVGYPALVETGRAEDAVWVIARPRTVDDYRMFAERLNVQGQSLSSIEAYQAAVVAKGGRLLPGGDIEWPMPAHINIHRGGPADPGSKGCQTIHPARWATFIEAVRRGLSDHHQATIPYVLLEAGELERFPV